MFFPTTPGFVVAGFSPFYTSGMSVCADHAGASTVKPTRINPSVCRRIGRPTSPSTFLDFLPSCSRRKPHPAWEFNPPTLPASLRALAPSLHSRLLPFLHLVVVVFDQREKANKPRAFPGPGG